MQIFLLKKCRIDEFVAEYGLCAMFRSGFSCACRCTCRLWCLLVERMVQVVLFVVQNHIVIGERHDRILQRNRRVRRHGSFVRAMAFAVGFVGDILLRAGQDDGICIESPAAVGRIDFYLL